MMFEPPCSFGPAALQFICTFGACTEPCPNVGIGLEGASRQCNTAPLTHQSQSLTHLAEAVRKRGGVAASSAVFVRSGGIAVSPPPSRRSFAQKGFRVLSGGAFYRLMVRSSLDCLHEPRDADEGDQGNSKGRHCIAPRRSTSRAEKGLTETFPLPNSGTKIHRSCSRS